ncbi:MAG: hypothetical protein AAGK04_14580 [Planctomycetota bacterium]
MRRATPMRSPNELPDPSQAEPIPVEGLSPEQIAANARKRVMAREGRSPAPSGESAPAASSNIRVFDQGLSGKKHEDEWARTPNATGTGAIHVRSFHCKLTGESLSYLDQQINEWLDAHPQYEVKFVTTGLGEWVGKTKEQHLVVQVWV